VINFSKITVVCCRHANERPKKVSADALRRADFDYKSLKDAAYFIRNQILSSETTNLPEPTTVEAIDCGQANKPGALTEFINVLYTGSSKVPKNE